jgi:uncharacterized phiE125 gp8 family phage protein
MKMTFDIVTPAVTLEQVKTFLRVDDDIEDSLIAMIRDAATEYIIRWTGQALGILSVTEYFDDWEAAASLNLFPIISDSGSPSITYLDENNDSQVLSSGFEIVENSVPAKIVYTSTPSLGSNENRIQITYSAGKTTTSAMLRIAVLTLAAHWYENREAVTLGTIQSATLIQLEAILHMSGIPYLGVSEE